MEKKILLIDDESDFTDLTAALLGFHNLEVRVYNSLVEIEKIVEDKEFTLIVTDLMMPGIDGFEVIQKFRATPHYKTTPMIALSAKNLSDDERKFLLKNHVSFLPKPFEPKGLVEKIRQILDGAAETH